MLYAKQPLIRDTQHPGLVEVTPQRDILIMFDIRKAFDTVTSVKLWHMLAKRCANNTDCLIVDHLIELHSLTEISCGEKTLTANKGSPPRWILLSLSV